MSLGRFGTKVPTSPSAQAEKSELSRCQRDFLSCLPMKFHDIVKEDNKSIFFHRSHSYRSLISYPDLLNPRREHLVKSDFARVKCVRNLTHDATTHARQFSG